MPKIRTVEQARAWKAAHAAETDALREQATNAEEQIKTVEGGKNDEHS